VYPPTFTSVFFNTAIASAAWARLDGRRLTMRQALAVPTRRLGQVALWSLLAAGVGVIVNQLASRLPLAGSIAARLFGLTWSLAACSRCRSSRSTAAPRPPALAGQPNS
jgi:hypothetical protein